MSDIIFKKKKGMVSTFIVPYITGIGYKSPEEAKAYIKYGETLDANYYPDNIEEIEMNGEESVYYQHMKELFSSNNIDLELSQIVGQIVYKPNSCYSGIFMIDLGKGSNGIGLNARPCGVTALNETIIMVNNIQKKFYSNTQEEIELKLLSTMAVWKAKKGIYIMKHTKNIICLDFDEKKWIEVLKVIKQWSDKLM